MRARLMLLFCFLSVWPMASNVMAQDCTNPEDELGAMVFNYTHGVFQGCTQDGWQAFHVPVCPDGDECAGTADTFAFDDVTGAVTSTQIESNILQINGLTGTGTVSITGDGTPEFRVCSIPDCSTEITTWVSANSSINTGDYLQLRLTSSASGTTLHSATVTVNGTSDQWDVTTGAAADACETGTIGTVCADGAVYAGDDRGWRMYVADADESGTYAYGGYGTDLNGDNAAVAPELLDDGLANTDWLLTSGTGDHDAAQACRNKGSNWYLPAINELGDLFANRAQLGPANLPTSTSEYWSSSETSSNGARIQRLNDGYQVSSGKIFTVLVRCVRR